MILNSDVTASQKLGVAGSSPSFIDRIAELKDKALSIKLNKTQWIAVVGGCLVFIVFRKIHYKAKTHKINLGGYKK